MNEREIFIAAQAIRESDQRSRFLREQCGGNESQQARIESLLSAAEKDDSFLELPETQDTKLRDDRTMVSGTRIGPYKILEQIGEGGFGTVYMAEQYEPMRRTVAVKVIKPGMDSRQVIARFEAERQALAIMDHPNIAKVLDAGTTERGSPYFVMELVKGIPITTFCDERRASLTERLHLFVNICQAIQHAHNKGIIHRDIKPGNVLVAMYDDQPVAKVIDFGVAKATGGQLTERTLHTGFGSIVGSLEYMSPEQASFNQLDVDTRSDVYSLGILLYELLTGSPPLSRDDLRRVGMLESLRMVRETEPVRPSTRLSTAEGLPSLAANRNAEPSRLTAIIKGDLDWIVMKALDKDRGRRYETVNSLSEEIHRFIRGEPVSAHPPSRLYRIRKWTRKHWQAVATMATVIALAAAIAFLVLRNWNQRKAQIAAHSARVAAALGEASLALGSAKSAPIGQDAPWVAARAAAARLDELLAMADVDTTTTETTNNFLADFQHLDGDRRLAEQIENVVIMSATDADLASWQRMEQQFREMFMREGINTHKLAPDEIARQIRTHRSSAQLCDALELWIGTKGQISSLGGEKATRQSMQPLSDAMLAADDDPIRSGIRRLIYGGVPFTTVDVDQVTNGVHLESLTPRTLSWLASVYMMAGDMKAADEIFYRAVDHYPDDFMLNFDFAYMLERQQRWPEAIRYFLRCTALRPDVSGVWRGLASACRENGEWERAGEAIARAATLSPKQSSLHVELAQVLIELGRFDKAESSARRAIELGSLLPMSQFCLAQSLLKQSQYAEALIALSACEKLNESNPRKAVPIKEFSVICKQKLAEESGQNN